MPASLIVGFGHNVATNYPGNSGNNFAIQLRDIELEHDFFQDPSDTDFLVTQGAQFGRFPASLYCPALIPSPGMACSPLKHGEPPATRL